MFVVKSRNTALAAIGRHIVAALAILLSPAIAEAGSIAIDQLGMTGIFSQSSFDAKPISIRFNPPRLILAPELLVIDNPTDLNALYGLAPDPAPTVDAFFVDEINSCGSAEAATNGLFAGCAQVPGHVLVEESRSAELSPAPLMGHELGHNLNLQHDLFSSANLMAPFFPPGTLLTEEQVSTIRQSPLVQTDSIGLPFIQITPIAIVAIPEPSTLLLFGALLGVLLIINTNRSRA